MDGKGKRLLLSRAGLLCGGIVAVRADRLTATQQHCNSMVGAVGYAREGAVGRPILSTPTTAGGQHHPCTTVATQTVERWLCVS